VRLATLVPEQIPTETLLLFFTVQLPWELFVETLSVPVEGGGVVPPVLGLKEPPPPPHAEKRKAETNSREIK